MIIVLMGCQLGAMGSLLTTIPWKSLSAMKSTQWKAELRNGKPATPDVSFEHLDLAMPEANMSLDFSITWVTMMPFCLNQFDLAFCHLQSRLLNHSSTYLVFNKWMNEQMQFCKYLLSISYLAGIVLSSEERSRGEAEMTACLESQVCGLTT